MTIYALINNDIEKTISYTHVQSRIIHNNESWEQPKCPLMSEWMNRMWYIRTMKHYSTLRKNEIMTHVKTWMKLDDVMLSEIN